MLNMKNNKSEMITAILEINTHLSEDTLKGETKKSLLALYTSMVESEVVESEVVESEVVESEVVVVESEVVESKSTQLLNRNDDLKVVAKKIRNEIKSNVELILIDIIAEYNQKKLNLPSLTKKVILWEMNRQYNGKSKMYEIVIEFLATKISIDVLWSESKMKYILKLVENNRVSKKVLKNSSTIEIDSIVESEMLVDRINNATKLLDDNRSASKSIA